MLLEYFQMIDQVETIDLEAGTLRARSHVPEKSPVFEGHFPGMPLVPGVLLIETMAQACGFFVLASSNFESMPFLMQVDSAKMRTFVEPGAALSVTAERLHEGSGFTVAKAQIEADGKRICDAQLKLRVTKADNPDLAALIRERAAEIGLIAAIAADKTRGDAGAAP